MGECLLKIAVTSDIHIGTLGHLRDLKSYISSLEKEGFNFLLIAGDLVSRGANHSDFRKALDILSSFSGYVLLTFGNHDLWTVKGSSLSIYRNLPKNLGISNVHILDGNPFLCGRVAFVGSVGWYDYSFRKVPPSFESLFSPYVFEFKNNGNVELLKWKEIKLHHYKDKTCVVSKDGKHWKKTVWQDKYYIHWDLTDVEFLDLTINTLVKDIERVYSQVDEIIVLTHHLPFADFVPDIPDPSWSFHRAYLGSVKLGEVLKRYDKISHIFFGHSHPQEMLEMHYENFKAINLFFHGDLPSYYFELENC